MEFRKHKEVWSISLSQPKRVRFTDISIYTFPLTHPHTVSLSSSSLPSSVSVPLAYQLRVCQPPPEVPNAVMLIEDGELEIGELSAWVACHDILYMSY